MASDTWLFWGRSRLLSYISPSSSNRLSWRLSTVRAVEVRTSKWRLTKIFHNSRAQNTRYILTILFKIVTSLLQSPVNWDNLILISPHSKLHWGLESKEPRRLALKILPELLPWTETPSNWPPWKSVLGFWKRFLLLNWIRRRIVGCNWSSEYYRAVKIVKQKMYRRYLVWASFNDLAFWFCPIKTKNISGKQKWWSDESDLEHLNDVQAVHQDGKLVNKARLLASRLVEKVF